MATCNSLEHIFENPILPENPTLLESLSPWPKHIKPKDDSSFTELFGELHFKENRIVDSSYESDKNKPFSSMNSESLSICTEGLGFESSDDVDDLLSNGVYHHIEEKKGISRNYNVITLTEFNGESKRSRKGREADFPPPISSIGRSGKPWVSLKSYREDGRFILKETRIPTQEFLHASREDGRLKLKFIQSDDDDDENGEEDEENVEENGEDLDNNGEVM